MANGETMETVRDFILGVSKITEDGEGSHEIKRRLLLGRKAVTNLDSILKIIDSTNKGSSSQSYGFSSIMYVCEICTIKKAEHQRMMLLNCGVGEDSWESLGWQGDQASQS